MGKNAQRRHRSSDNSPIVYHIGLTTGSGSPVMLSFSDATTGKPRFGASWTTEAADAMGMALLSTARMARNMATRDRAVAATLTTGVPHPTGRGAGGEETNPS